MQMIRPKLTAIAQRPAWLRTDRLLGERRRATDDLRARPEFSRRMETARRQADDPRPSDALLRRGWRFGSKEFQARLLDRIQGTRRPSSRAQTARDRGSKDTTAIRTEMERFLSAFRKVMAKAPLPLNQPRVAVAFDLWKSPTLHRLRITM